MQPNTVYKYKGNFYRVMHIGVSKLPFHEKEPVVIYHEDNINSEIYIRFLKEFKEKFKKVEG